MCLAVPMEIVSLQPEGRALVRQEGLEIEVDVSLLENPRVGDYAIVHAGFAIETVDPGEAEERLRLFDELAQAGGDPSGGR